MQVSQAGGLCGSSLGRKPGAGSTHSWGGVGGDGEEEGRRREGSGRRRRGEGNQGRERWDEETEME